MGDDRGCKMNIMVHSGGALELSARIVEMTIAEEQSLLQLLAGLVWEEQWQELEGGQKRSQIYTLPVVLAIMLLQRLNERGTQQEAVHQVAAGRWDVLLADCERVRGG